MSTSTYAVRDSATMLRRSLRHALRYPGMTISSLAMPVLIMLLFAGLFGDTLGAGLGGAAHGGSYINYIAPGIILMGVGSGCVGIAVAVCTDMTEGIVARFKTMAISRASVLTGHVVGNMIQTLISTALVIAVAMLMGFRPTAGPVEWLAAAGLMVLLTLALTWFGVALGLVSKTPEAASNKPLLVQFLPFLGSAIVPTDSMPAGIRWFAEYQPFTPLIETLRGLLTGGPIGHNGILAVSWCVVLLVIGYFWSKKLYNRDLTRS
ncbi:ABC transporter permease [Solihabitans fulvus]|uniref:Transport permease protein n=1 Tax=Solihabitans fulvus TaxID=1892852 RepID=A0A5B2WQ47_9PSEU|nr:ABC transporter permease [Solihabitans fulvus]KAA2253595.1 ABC transporter permease [Solihabitans fulvus]